MHNVCFLELVTPEKIYHMLITSFEVTTCNECFRLQDFFVCSWLPVVVGLCGVMSCVKLGISSSPFYWASVANAPKVLQPFWLRLSTSHR